MTYRTTITIAALFSIAAHAAILPFAPRLFYGPEDGAAVDKKPVLILNLVEDERVAKRLIETREGTDEPVEDAEFISDKNSIAQDMSDEDGDEARPAVEETVDVDQLAKVAALPREGRQFLVPVPEEPVLEPKQEEVAAISPELAQETVDPRGAVTVEESSAEALSAITLSEDSTVLREERVKVADAQIVPPSEEWDAPEAGRKFGGATARGYTNFQAKDDRFAPYMLEVRRRVERRWRTALSLKFSGSNRAVADLECAINPQGEMVYVRIVNAGRSVSYAAICKEAVERAGPFPPFPFKVPELYRNKNLEIRWRFSFM